MEKIKEKIKQFSQVNEREIFTPASSGEDVRRFALWRVFDLQMGLAVEVRPPNFENVVENGQTSGTFFGREESVRIVATLPPEK